MTRTTPVEDGQDSPAHHDGRDAPTVAEVREVDHAYGSLSVLSGVSAAIHPGELVAVVGPNGSGKSTFLRVLAGVHDPTSGAVLDSAGRPRSSRSDASVGYLPQHLHPRDEFTVRETIAYYTALVDGGFDPERVVELVGLGGVADRRVAALSGGMRRLLGVGIATVGAPELVVLDEPTSGLDRTMARRVFGVCRDVAATGAGVVLASHDLSLVDRAADRVLFLDGGRIAFDGPPSDFGDESTAFPTAYDRRVESGGSTTVRGGRR